MMKVKEVTPSALITFFKYLRGIWGPEDPPGSMPVTCQVEC